MSCVFYIHVFSCVCIRINWYMCTVYIQCVRVSLYFYLGEDLISYLQSEDILKNKDILSSFHLFKWLLGS